MSLRRNSIQETIHLPGEPGQVSPPGIAAEPKTNSRTPKAKKEDTRFRKTTEGRPGNRGKPMLENMNKRG